MPPAAAPTTDTAATDEQPIQRAVKFSAPTLSRARHALRLLDVDGETFTADTDFCVDWFGSPAGPLLYDHGLDATHQGRKVGTPDGVRGPRRGHLGAVPARARTRSTARRIDALIEAGALGYRLAPTPTWRRRTRSGEITALAVGRAVADRRSPPTPARWGPLRQVRRLPRPVRGGDIAALPVKAATRRPRRVGHPP